MDTLQARQTQREIFQQGENAAKVYTVNWKAELDTDTIETSEWTVESSNSGVFANDSVAGNETSARLSGDTGNHLFTNKITTTNGNTLERQIILKVQDNDLGFVRDYC